MTVLVTGIGGFLGGALVARLAASGHEVHGLSSSGARVPGAARVDRWSFGSPVDPAWFASVDAVVHVAHDFRPGTGERTLAGTLDLARAAADAGVSRQVLVSSLAARPDAITEYGRTKYAQEAWFLEAGFPVVRPGTILGPGGLFGRIAVTVLSRPVVPLVDGGRQRMYVVGTRDLCLALERFLAEGGGEVVPLYLEDEVDLRDVVERLLALHHRRAVLLPVPSLVLLAGLVAAEKLGIRLPVGSDNLRGLRASQAGIPPSRLRDWVADPETLDAVLLREFPPAD